MATMPKTARQLAVGDEITQGPAFWNENETERAPICGTVESLPRRYDGYVHVNLTDGTAYLLNGGDRVEVVAR